MTRPTAGRLAADILSLGGDHRDVLESIMLAIVQRSTTALPQYGALDLTNDARDFRDELIAELLDGLTYTHADNVKLRRELADAQLATLELDALRKRYAIAVRR